MCSTASRRNQGVLAMTYTIFSGYTNGAANAFTMGSGDMLATVQGSLLGSTGANGVYAIGSVSIEVGGTIGGYFNGISDSTASGQSSTVYIDRTGYVFSAPGGEGVFISGAAQHSITNLGSIQTLGTTGWGIATNGAGLIVNELGGYINGGSAIYQNDIAASDLNTILNYGTIVGIGYAFQGIGADKEVLDNQGTMVGEVVMSSNAANLLYNLGTMDATNTGNYTGFAVRDSAVFNAGLMYQVVAGSTAATMIQTGNGVGDYVYNTGTLAEIVGAGANSADAAILMGNGAGDYVYNSGVIYGNVVLGNGAGDAYLGVNGKISGTIICGSGGDRINTGSDIEIVKAGTGNDTFNVGNGGESIIQETAANQISNGFDIMSNFQSYVAASQQGTFLQLDPSFASSTTFSAYNGGTLVQMSLGSGHYSYVDVLGASVAAVQAQTYFA
jgi:hypothetical protein